MARKKAKTASRKLPPGRQRYRRNDEELISDLQEKIRELRDRQRARELKQSPAMKAFLTALKSIDRALAAAAGNEETLMRHVLADARKPLAEFAEKRGVSVPKAALPRGRRPKEE